MKTLQNYIHTFKAVFTSILIITAYSAVLSQNEKVDSLLGAVDKEENKEMQGRLYAKLCREYNHIDIDKSIEFGLKSVALLKSIATDNEYLPASMLDLAFSYNSIDDTKKFKETLDEVFNYLKKPSDFSSAYNLMGRYYQYINPDSAEYYFRQNMKMRIQLNKLYFIPVGYNQLGMSCAMQGKLVLADSFWQLGIQMCTDSSFDNEKTTLLYNLCVLHSQTSNYDQMLIYAKQGYALAVETDNQDSQMNFLNVLTNISLFQGDSIQANEHRLEAYQLIKRLIPILMR